MANLLQRLTEMQCQNLPGAADAVQFMRDAEFTQGKPDAMPETGQLSTLCGGVVLFGFYRCDGLRGCVYIVFDDNAGSTWDWKRAEGKPMHELGPRPHQVMRVVVSL